MRVGFIGLGDQGAPIARAIGEAGWPLYVWARRPNTLKAVARIPHIVCNTLSDLGKTCDLVGLCLLDDSDVEEILIDSGLLQNLKPGNIVANHGTGSPDACPSLEQRGREVGAFVLDAPVSGGRDAAIHKTLSTMVGGDRQAYERCRPVFETFSRLVSYIGPAGSGQFTKLMNNTLFAANLKNAEEMLALAEHLGFDLKGLSDVVLVSSGASFAVEALARHIRTELVEHYEALLHKNVHHFSDCVRQRGLQRSPLEDLAEQGVDGIATAIERLTSMGTR